MAAQEEDRDTFALGYPIVVGADLRDVIADYVRRRASPCLVLGDADANVSKMTRRIAAAADCKRVLEFRLGESRKNMATLEAVLDAMHEAAAERETLVLGVGGGVASDLFGLAAATYMRGVPYGHVATSLVAMVDAAIGGKTGVNLRAGKNLAGAFRDPVAVFCDVAALRTLPKRALREGLAEVVKAAIIQGGEFFEGLEMLSPHP
ncbi:MAG TPA: iron-containing alcohol dehydrogenase, partial [Xanthobacteraceae bacterium]